MERGPWEEFAGSGGAAVAEAPALSLDQFVAQYPEADESDYSDYLKDSGFGVQGSDGEGKPWEDFTALRPEVVQAMEQQAMERQAAETGLRKPDTGKEEGEPQNAADLMSGRFTEQQRREAMKRGVRIPTMENTGLIPKDAIEPVLRYATPLGLASVATDAIAPNSAAAKVTHGVLGGASEALAGFTTPEGIAALAIMPEAKIAQIILNAGFGAKAISELPSQIKAYAATDDPEEKAKIATGMAVSLGLPALGTTLALRRPAEIPNPKSQAPNNFETSNKGGEITDANSRRTSTAGGGQSQPGAAGSGGGSETFATETARFAGSEEAQRQSAEGEAGESAGYENERGSSRDPETEQSGPWSDYGGPPEGARQAGPGDGREPGGTPVDRPSGAGATAPEPAPGNAAGGSAVASSGVSMPVMITRAMESDLRARGFTDADIYKMTPQEANEILADVQSVAPDVTKQAPNPNSESFREQGLQAPEKSQISRSKEERARLDYMRELEEEARGFQAGQGDEFWEAVEKSGGIPSRTSEARGPFAGEIQNIEEALRDPQRRERISLNKIFRVDAPDVDTLATRMRDRGFDISGPDDFFAAADNRIRTGREIFGQPEMADVFSPAKRGGIAPIPGPPIPPGQTLMMGELPVSLARTRPGTATGPEVLNALKDVMKTAGSVGEIRSGRFQTRTAKGIFKTRPEVIRLEHINDVPTAVHEVGHALMKQFYGTVKSRGLKWAPSATRRELIGLGKELYGSRQPVAGYAAEGFAEFLRLYLTTDGAGKVAPNALRFFEEGVLVDHPEVAAKLQAARGLIDTYRTQGALARANAQVVRDPGWTRRVTTALKDFFSFQKLVESAMPLRELSLEAARKGGGELRPSADPYKLFKMKRGTSGAILDRMVEDGMVDVWGNPTGGPSLREALEPVRAERGNFLLYLFARRAEERWTKGLNPGITKEDAGFIRQTLESPTFDRVASKYYQWWDGVLHYLVQADPRMAETVAAIKNGSSDYAPLARMLDESAVRREAALSQSNPLYRMKGSGLPVKDIFDQTLTGAARLISRANRALVTNAIVKLARIEGMGRVIEEVPLSKVRKTLNVEQIRGDLEALGLDTAKLPEDQVLEYFTPAEEPRGSDPIVPYKGVDGATRWYYVDPKLYDSLSAIEPFSLRSIPHLGPALDLAFGAPKRLFTLGTTGLRASFSLITNPLRDPQGWLLQTKAGINPAKMAAAYFQAIGEQLRAVATGKEGPLSKAAFDLGPQMAQPLGRDMNYTKRASNALFHGRLMRLVKSPIDHVRQLINLPESFPRLAEFKRVGEEIGWKPGDPMSPDQAVQLAIAFKEATVDFSASGDVSRIVNEVVPFFNPNIQGARTAARAFRDHPLRTTLWGLGALTGPTLLLWWQNKDKEWYRNLPWRERYYYTNLDDGKNVWQIPRPFEWSNLFQVIPEAAFDSWYRQEPRAMTEAVGHIFQTQNPLDYPVLLKLAKEQWQNRLDFWDRPIVPKSEVDLAPGAQVGPYTSRVATWLGKAFPNQISPRRVDAAFRSAVGGAVPDLLDAIGLGSQKQTRESELADTAVVGKLWRRGGFYNAQSQHMADFWDIKTNLDARSQAVKMQLKDPQRAQNIPLTDPSLVMAPVFDSLGKDISMMLRLANQMKESAARQRLYYQAAQEAKAAVDLYHKQQANIEKRR